MAFQNVRSVSLLPTSEGVITKNRFVKLGAGGAAGKVIQATVAGEDVIGIALEGSAAGDGQAIPVSILDGSIQEIVAGGAINIVGGVRRLATDTSGRAVVATTGNVIIGIALSSAAAAGDIITFLSHSPGAAAS